MTPGRRVCPDHRTEELLLRPGDYGRTADGMWHAMPPTANPILIHDGHVQEHDHGLISVSFTIAASDGAGQYWTGHLIQGNWIER